MGSPLSPPPSASTTSDAVDVVAAVVFTIIGLVTLAVVVAAITLVIRYRRRPGNLTGRVPNANFVRKLEIAFSTGTTVVFLSFFVLGAAVFDELQHPPDDPDALDIYVTAKRWMWKFHHPNGRREVGRLHVPVGRVVRLHLYSEDVIHSFYVPAFRVKRDVVPGWLNVTWFEAKTPGVYPLACAEYCGTSHAGMRAEIVVMEPYAYDQWLQSHEDDEPPLASAGRALFERYDCVACHETHLRRRAPPLSGVYGRTVTLADGSEVIADEAYLRRAILDPSAQVVAGYQAGEMPSFAGVLRDDELLLLIAYLRSLGREGVHR
ncbi:MAG TPA: cytochrome c oxidase subunit II [Nannocystis sp.]